MKKEDKTMKSLKYFVLCGLIAVGLSSCEKNEMPVFDVEYAALNIWFGSATNSLGTATVLDSTTYNYSYAMGEKTLTFYARVADYDRTFDIEVFDGDIDEAEGSFRTETYTLKAGETEVACSIYFNTSLLKDKNSFTEKDGHLYFRLVKNKEFVTGTGNMSSLVVVLKNYLTQPEEWYTAVAPHRPYYSIYSSWNYFGEYSKVKYQFMISELGLIDFHISSQATKFYDEATNTISMDYATFLKQKLQVALEEYNSNPENPNTPLKDENGTVIDFD